MGVILYLSCLASKHVFLYPGKEGRKGPWHKPKALLPTILYPYPQILLAFP